MTLTLNLAPELEQRLAREAEQQGLSLDNWLLEQPPLTTVAMRQAALFWAQARQHGQPTAGDTTIDCDVILGAQAATRGVSDAVIATTNVGHLGRFASAEL